MMMMREISTVLVLLLVALTAAQEEGEPCHHYSYPCGEKVLVSEEIQPCTNCRGPNVCKTVRTYMKHYYSAVYERKCYRSSWYWNRQRCWLECTVTDSCTVTKNVSRVEYHCCDGFTTNSSAGNYYHYWYRENPRYLKKYGCPRVLQNSTLDCLTELGLTEFASLLSRTELESTLGSDDDSPKFTIFAAPNEIVRNSQLGSLPTSALSIILGSHVTMEEVHLPRLFNGLKFQSLSSGRFIHVSQIYETSDDSTEIDKDTYINGHELIGPDACVASNGIVHIIGGVIDSTDQSIAEVVQDSSSLTSLESLLTKANLLSYLNNTHYYLMTLFAPTNAAFERSSSALNVDIVRCLTADQHSRELKQFLKYHITCNAHYSPILARRTMVTTEACHFIYTWWYRWGYRQCKKVTITVNDDGIEVGETGSMVSQADIPASNGVIHEISLPLINPWLNLTELCTEFPLTPSPSPSPTASINVVRPTIF